MGNSEGFENLDQNISPASLENEEELNKLAEKGKIGVIQELKEAQSLSEDKFFQQMDINSLDDEAFICLHKVVKKYGTPFPATVIAAALDFYLTDNKLLRGEEFYDPITPENTEDFLKEQVARYPNVFYHKDMILDLNDYGKKVQGQEFTWSDKKA